MAGIEQLEVHSKSYIVRWVRIEEHDTLSWSVQPHKKSINFGIVKHPGSGATALTSVGEDIDPAVANGQNTTETKGGRFPKKESNAQDLLASKGFISVKWFGKCEADKVSIGTHDVPQGQGGMYGLVFDNTFSKQTSKTATFVVLTYPTSAPPSTANHLPNLQLPQARGSETSLGRHAGARLEGAASASVDSLNSHNAGGKPNSVSGRSEGLAGSAACHVGNLSKRRRKKGQGYARRYFSLDYSTCTLSYYYNRNSSALRGAIPLSLAAIAADERRREISIDSGAEVWHLKAPNDREFQEWARALEKASKAARGFEAEEKPSRSTLRVDTRPSRLNVSNSHEDDAEWRQVETLVSRVVGTRDALRRLTKDVAALSKPPNSSLAVASAPAIDEGADSYFLQAPERRPFWKRKSSASVLNPSTLQHATSSALAVPAPNSASVPLASAPDRSRSVKRRSKGFSGEEKSLPDHCQALLTDLDSVVGEFTTLINNSKRRRMPMPHSASAVSRRSIDTTSTAEEFFDAEDANSGVLKIDGSEDGTPGVDGDDTSIHDSSSMSSMEDDDRIGTDDPGHLYPAKPKSLAPLPVDGAIQRRTSMPPATVLPPSLIGFVRKNVGKDLSTISMPVSANEPLSLLQKIAEQLEYAQLLDQAVNIKTSAERLLYVTAFAISQFSSGRTRERAIRKPFNPLLGETFEMVRSSSEVPGGFRLLVEKVCHRPVKLAMQADSANWSFSQTAAPGQKFWGKSAEITTEGRVRVALRLPNGEDEFFSWSIATMFLRNVVMGEKYVEPVGSMTVSNDSSGEKAVVEFKTKGMFGGRAEEVQGEIFAADGRKTGPALQGTWTTSLKSGRDDVWQVGKLIDKAPQTYGMTLFAASLNEITDFEKGKLPPTDSRLRPDQRLAEEGSLDEAEDVKHKLEEAQRARRKATEERGEAHKPRWFSRADDAPDGEEVWRIKGGKDSYWEERAKGSWSGVEEIFAV